MIGRAAIGSGALRVLNAGLGFTTAVVLARSLGPHDYGLYTTALVFASTLAIIVQFGLPNFIMRETAAAAVDDDGPRMAAIWIWATRNALLLSVAVMLLGGMSVAYVKHNAPIAELLTYALAIAFIPLTALGALRAGALRGLRHVVLAQLPEQAVKPGLMLLMALALGTLLPAQPGVAMAMQFVAVTLAFLVGAALLRLKRPEGALPSAFPIRYLATPSLRVAASFALVAGATRINQYADILTLSAFRSPAEVGVYRAIWQTSLLIAFGSGIATMIFPPLFARYHAQGDRVALRVTLRKARLMGTAAALPPVLALLFLGDSVVGKLFGPAFFDGLMALKILAVMQLANAIAGPLGAYLSMTGREVISARLHLVAAGVNIVLNIALVPSLGMTGAALATLISYVLLNLTLVLCLKFRSLQGEKLGREA
ncbi:oligosaccharide flippase family protein [Thioclava indica]|uniref:Uncharacterized protein n=1 Tax=Thioclava indica TaxID=1353528 RepID=A0A074JMJ7_9RHOB|nr:oligosaccharide flippase family protein [Thioclava indica]KEO57110.1 hypothetical protein DT23_17225 [Thioclava indica]